MKSLERNELINEDDLDVLHLIQEDPEISQRKIATKLGFSLGKVNYSIKSLVKIGFLKLQNFSDSQNKKAYIYFLTPKGIVEKASITKRFLQAKREEYEKLNRYLRP